MRFSSIIVLFFIAIFIGFVSYDIKSSSLEGAVDLARKGDIQKAILILETLSNKGNSEAKWALANIFLSTIPNNRNISRAIDLLSSLAGTGDLNSKALLGDIYYYGNIVPKNYKKAAKWYSQYIEEKRDPDILVRYGILLATGQGVEINKFEAFKLFYEAESQKYIPAVLLRQIVYQKLNLMDSIRAHQYLKSN